MILRLIPTVLTIAAIAVGGCNTTKTDPRASETAKTPPAGSEGRATSSESDGTGPLARPGVGSLTSVAKATGDVAPDFSWSDATGEHRLSDYRGRVVMINFWGTWCPPCRRELPALVKIREELSRDKFEIIGINVGEQPRGGASVEQHVGEFAQQNRIRYPLVIADENLANAYGGIEVVPTTIIVNGEGRIVERIQGSREEEAFRSLIQKAM
jgi:thiol-disulfide isomerase/thioredoxin